MRRRIARHCLPDIVCLVLATLLFGCSILDARAGVSGATPPAQSGSEGKPTVKERILEIPPGTMIEVRLLNKQKIRGRLGEITDEGFSLQTAQGNKIETQKLGFTDVKSFKQVEGTTGKKIGTGVVYALAGIGALFVGLVIWAASRED